MMHIFQPTFKFDEKCELVAHGLKKHITSNIYVTQDTYRSKSNPHAWQVLLVNFFKNDEIVLKIEHTYSNFNYHFFEKDGKQYVICPTESYMEGMIYCFDTDQNVILNTKGWCPVMFYTNLSKTIVAIAGCFWAAPYTYRFYDIRDMSCPKLMYEEEMEYEAENEHWIEDDVFQYTYIRNTGRDGKTDEDPPWKSYEIINIEVKPIPESKMFNAEGDYSAEFLKNFQDIKTINLKEKEKL